MSDNKAGKLRKFDFHINYVPIALEVCVSFIPFLILIVWCLYWMLAEMTGYSDGLDWISMVRIVEMESSLFEEQMADEKVEELNLATDFGQASMSYKYRVSSSEQSTEFDRLAERDEDEDIRISYVFLKDNGDLMEVDPNKQELFEIPEDSPFYHQAVLALTEVQPRESLRRMYYEYSGESYYRSFRLLKPVKPVRCGEWKLSDGKTDSRILISGRFWYEMLNNNSKLDRKRLNIHIVIVDVIFVGVICLYIYLSLRNLRQIIRIMQGYSSGKADFSGAKFKESGGIPEITELTESFRLMFLSIRKYYSSVSGIREIYEPTLPAAFLEMFKRDDIRDIQPDDTALVRGTVVSLRFDSDSNTGKMHAQQRNVLICRILDILASMNVIVTELEADSISGICPDKDRDDAVFDKKLNAIRSMDLAGSGVDRLTVTSAEGYFYYTIVGNAEHKRVRMKQIPETEQGI